jgi:ABC-type transport system involved in cytochrome c biogenesis permease subunit
MSYIQPFRRRLTSGGDLFWELRRAWLRAAVWQLLTAVCGFAAAGAIHKPISAVYVLVALLAARGLAVSLGIWRRVPLKNVGVPSPSVLIGFPWAYLTRAP